MNKGNFIFWSFMVIVISLIAIIGVKSSNVYTNVEYVVTDVYSTMRSGTIRTHTTYCNVKRPSDCIQYDEHRIEPKYKVGDHFYQSQQEFGPTSKFIMGTALLFLMVSVLVFFCSGVLWIVDSAIGTSTRGASDFEP